MLRWYSVYFLNKNVPFKTMLLKEIINERPFKKDTLYLCHWPPCCFLLFPALWSIYDVKGFRHLLSLLSIFIHVSKNFSVCANKRKIGMSVTMDQLNWVYLPIFCSLFLYWSNTTGCSVALCFNLWCSTDASCFNFAREWFKTFTLQIKLADKLLNCYEHCETVAVWFDLTPKLFG